MSTANKTPYSTEDGRIHVFWHEGMLEHDTGKGVFDTGIDPGFLDVLEKHPENSDRVKNMLSILKKGPISPFLSWHSGRPALISELHSFHTTGKLITHQPHLSFVYFTFFLFLLKYLPVVFSLCLFSLLKIKSFCELPSVHLINFSKLDALTLGSYSLAHDFMFILLLKIESFCELPSAHLMKLSELMALTLGSHLLFKAHLDQEHLN